MAEPSDPRVAVYIDFDNIVISRYDQLHGDQRFHRDKARNFSPARSKSEVATKLHDATIDVGAIIDFASSFGSIVISRAYADWSVPVNAGYQKQLIERAVDLTQLFPTTAGIKNGADIRLSVDVVEDLFRLPDLTHVVIVAGDSDYIALAQKSKRLGRYVVGIGVAGGTSRSLAAACDEFADYDALPGIKPRKNPTAPRPTVADEQKEKPAATKKKTPDASAKADADAPADPQRAATDLLVRALRLGHAKDDEDWLHNSAVKTQMKRMDPSFQESALGFKSFSEFVKSRADVAELDESNQTRLVRLKPGVNLP
ncbi:NYN domain-containing protein [Cryobacterium sp. BB307]|uniref:NYN domain-containing protein n=1 Tax=Cryobacterium sp. BB307 TaxID=2716317 RepID=UPI001447E395|nr:NYN domain-containing protein [Cryobacterium sp. BB307]